MKSLHLHLVSDSTGETVSTVARASLVQFDDIQTTEHVWSMVRKKKQVNDVLAAIETDPGFVLYTIVNQGLCQILEDGCRRMQVPCVPILDTLTHQPKWRWRQGIPFQGT